jgi:D-alanyl-D-alanine carboxypeptidase/D-alanyl-D-alanine-endopeptidase (penicillin-binding protein 4)
VKPERLARLAAALLATALLAPADAGSAPATLQEQIDAIVSEPEYARALVSFEVRDLETGAVLASRGSRRLVQPASALKLLVSAAALDAFGPGRRFETTLESAARVDEAGRLLGDLYLVGGGDLGLSRRFGADRSSVGLEQLAATLVGSGIRRVEGRVIGHDGLFDAERHPEGWDWDDLVWSYGAPISALSFADNSAHLKARTGPRVGAPLRVEQDPVSDYYDVVSTAVTGPRRSRPELRLVRELGSNRIQLSGSWPLGAAPWEGSVALEDPPLYAATVLSEVLERRGVGVAGAASTSRQPLPDERRVLARHQGPPLSEVLGELNKESLNLFAETLLRLLGVSASGVGSAESGREALEAFLAASGVDTAGWSLRDASGLSESDLVSAGGLVDLLVAMDRHPQAAVFRASLPISGVDGTLERRLRRAATRGRVQAKTGTLRNVHALAGYATTAWGTRRAFAVVINHYTGRLGNRAIDRVVAAIVGGGERGELTAAPSGGARAGRALWRRGPTVDFGRWESRSKSRQDSGRACGSALRCWGACRHARPTRPWTRRSRRRPGSCGGVTRAAPPPRSRGPPRRAHCTVRWAWTRLRPVLPTRRCCAES